LTKTCLLDGNNMRIQVNLWKNVFPSKD